MVAADSIARTIDIKKPMKLEAVHPRSVFAHSHYGTREQANSILRVADWIVANGVDAPGDFRAARDLLLMNPPRLSGGQPLTGAPGQAVVELDCQLGLALDHSILPIQGPPGAGKTFTGSKMICELVRNGRKVGITATGHAVIRNLLDQVVEAARISGIPEVACAHRKDESDEDGAVMRACNTGALWVISRSEFWSSVKWGRKAQRSLEIGILFAGAVS